MHFSPKQRTSLYLINFFKCKILLQNKKRDCHPFLRKPFALLSHTCLFRLLLLKSQRADFLQPSLQLGHRSLTDAKRHRAVVVISLRNNIWRLFFHYAHDIIHERIFKVESNLLINGLLDDFCCRYRLSRRKSISHDKPRSA